MELYLIGLREERNGQDGDKETDVGLGVGCCESDPNEGEHVKRSGSGKEVKGRESKTSKR